MSIEKSLLSKAIAVVGIGLLLVGALCEKGNPVSTTGRDVSGTLTDADGNVYQTVNIGNQVWMAENLRTTKYNDSTSIPHAGDSGSAPWASLTTPGYCYYNNTTDAGNIKKFGALYNWYAVDTKKLAPAGWHVPTDAEWDTLENWLIGNGYNYDGTTTGNKTAKSLAAKTDWITDTITGTIGADPTKNNRSGFSAFPGGYRGSTGYFSGNGAWGDWWSATERDASEAYARELRCDSDSLHGYYGFKSCGYSVRLVRD